MSVADVSQEIIERLHAVETAQNGLSNRVALVEAEQKHSREMFDARLTALSAQFDSFRVGLASFDVKLDKISVLITGVTSDSMASAAGRAMVEDISRIDKRIDKNERRIEENATRINSWGSVIAAIKWVGFPALALMVIGGLVVFAKINHLL